MLSVSIVHITDLFTTLILWAGLDAPKDREIDGTDQRAFLRDTNGLKIVKASCMG